MEQDDLLLLAQLIDSMDQASRELEKAYNENNKQDYEKAKKSILEFQNKINFLLRR